MNPLQGTVVIKIFPGMSNRFKSSEQESINKTSYFVEGKVGCFSKEAVAILATKMSGCLLGGGGGKGGQDWRWDEGLYICPGGLQDCRVVWEESIEPGVRSWASHASCTTD